MIGKKGGQVARRPDDRHGNRFLGVLEVADMVPPLSRDCDARFLTCSLPSTGCMKVPPFVIVERQTTGKRRMPSREADFEAGSDARSLSNGSTPEGGTIRRRPPAQGPHPSGRGCGPPGNGRRVEIPAPSLRRKGRTVVYHDRPRRTLNRVASGSLPAYRGTILQAFSSRLSEKLR